MASQNYGLLDQAEEDAHHRSRLLNIEMRPFARIARRLLSSESLVYAPPHSYPTPPPDGAAVEQEAASIAALREKQAAERQQWHDEMVLDFAALEDSMVRIQLLRRSNEAERERYAAEKVKILETAQLVRANTAELRAQLEGAQKTLAMRKTYDELAEKITGSKMLKPRQDQHASIEKLEAEIAALEQESGAYAQTWAERREQFGRIVDEGKQMLRLIRDEKEEAERKEGMEEADEADGSRPGTPLTPAGDGGATPLPPMQNDLLAPGSVSGRRSRSSSLHRHDESRSSEAAAAASASRSRSASHAQSLSGSRARSSPEDGEDTEMAESADVDVGELPETGELEEGEEGAEARIEQMDTT